ncbi:fe2+ zn2+ uptake regulation protein [Pseudomonas sp. nanlin1]|uniref:fe2+ zn2+ uptake regulation protein n=1 Tax=Pseudomonas sp. nanlin1 TaxID=3040605 RepID=UPI00388EDF31
MQHSQEHLRALARLRNAPATPASPFADSTRGANEQIKRLLKSFGLRTSLIRLKVIDALLKAAENDRSIGVRGVHSHLEELGLPLSFLSVREVLKRLEGEGVIVLEADKCYRLTEQTQTMLQH